MQNLNKFTIVTFDSDFFDISSVKGHPPKIIWLRFGNTSTKKLSEYLKDKSDSIASFINDPDQKDIACLELR